jgi:hypothetical protein
MINRLLLASHNKKFSHTFKRLLLSPSKTTQSQWAWKRWDTLRAFLTLVPERLVASERSCYRKALFVKNCLRFKCNLIERAAQEIIKETKHIILTWIEALEPSANSFDLAFLIRPRVSCTWTGTLTVLEWSAIALVTPCLSVNEKL